MMKMIALIGQVNAEVTSRSPGHSVSGQVCRVLFSVYTLHSQSVREFCWVGLQDDDLFGIFPTVFSFPVIMPQLELPHPS